MRASRFVNCCVFTMHKPDLNTNELDNLVKQARQRDAAALAALCERYYPRVLKFMRYRVGFSAAEDLAGEVFARLMRSIDRQNGMFEPWLYRLARNVVIDRARRQQTRPESEWDDSMMNHPAEATDLGASVAGRLDLEQAITRLSDEQRELVTLKFLQGLSNDEIAEVTGRNAVAVRALQYRALLALRELMNHENT
jgi:RNA polymerase sigma-70 factor, ECF subfamily